MRAVSVRFTVRRMMAITAVLAVVLGVGFELLRRRERFLEVSREHRDFVVLEGTLILDDDGPSYTGLTTESGWWHEAMRRKYDHYVRRPWLPVPPDPPEPKWLESVDYGRMALKRIQAAFAERFRDFDRGSCIRG